MFVSKSSRGFFVLAMMLRAAMWKTTEASATRSRTSGASVTEPSTNWTEVGSVSAQPGEQVVEDGHARALLHQPANHRPAHEASPAGDQDAASRERAIHGVGHRSAASFMGLVPSVIVSPRIGEGRPGRKSRHQSRIPRIFVYPSAA